MAGNNITPPTTPPLRHSSERRSIDGETLSALTPNEESNQPKRASAPNSRTCPLRIFDVTSNTYSFENAQILGSGLWSKVYLAESRPSVGTLVAELTPPSTPQRLSLDLAVAKSKPYAVKMPARGDARDVLAVEARILSYLAADPSGQAYIVPFHGLDERNGGLVMDAIPETLDAFTKSLEDPSEDARKEQMTCLFPHIARRLVEGLAWLHSKGIVHGDIKPSNILMSQSSSKLSSNIMDTNMDKNMDSLSAPDMDPVYCDFSASLQVPLDAQNADPSSAPPSKVAGGGTWEYLAPELLALGSPDPTPSSDVYALGITLLTFLMGVSPFATMSDNRFMLRNAIKMGEPLRFANDGELKNGKRLAGWEEWLRPALAKKSEIRLTAKEWLAHIQKDMS